MSAKTILMLGAGKMSTFGGPTDMGVGPSEGLALVEPGDLGDWTWGSLFLSQQPEGTSGLARRLNPRALYCSMRWDEVLAPFGISYFLPNGRVSQATRDFLRKCTVRLSNGYDHLFVFAKPVDYGPGDGHVIDGKKDQDTGRIADLSTGAANKLALITDDQVTCELILAEVEA